VPDGLTRQLQRLSRAFLGSSGEGGESHETRPPHPCTMDLFPSTVGMTAGRGFLSPTPQSSSFDAYLEVQTAHRQEIPLVTLLPADLSGGVDKRCRAQAPEQSCLLQQTAQMLLVRSPTPDKEG
jgi:hypothetical protein